MSKSSKETISIQTEFDKLDFHGYPCEFSPYSFIPATRKDQTKERNFFNHHQQTQSSFLYDQVFQIKRDFNPKAHRDDRKHSKSIGLNVAKEEEEKCCASRSSTEYGRRHYQSNHFNKQSFGKIEHLKREFYRNNGNN